MSFWEKLNTIVMTLMLLLLSFSAIGAIKDDNERLELRHRIIRLENKLGIDDPNIRQPTYEEILKELAYSESNNIRAEEAPVPNSVEPDNNGEQLQH